ncbi:MAG: ABC transporter permease/substrate-binding protein, partial [Coriobacteriales bacterium]|nr:ABC transporter permease/substrate-binding protein [Coriobacteriales bacterium]
MLEEIVEQFVERAPDFLNWFIQHMILSFTAIIIATVLGLALGILISEFERSSKPTLTIVNILYTIPSLAMLGLLIPFTGTGFTTAIIALTAYGLLPMVKNTHVGIKNVDPAIIEAARGMGSTKPQILARIKLPLAMPVIFSGFRNMVTMTIALAGIAAYIGAGGLGEPIFRGMTTYNNALVFDGAFLMAALAIAVDLILGAIEKRLYKRNAQRKSKGGKKKHTALKRSGLVALVIVLVVAIAVPVSRIFGGGEDGAAGKPVKDGGTITVAYKDYNEQMIWGNILQQDLDANTNLTVNLQQFEMTPQLMPALESGDVDMYPEYSGTAWNQVLGRSDKYQDSMFPELQQAYKDQYDFDWESCFYGFDDTYAIAIPTQFAQEHNITTFSDLVPHSSQMTLGAEANFWETPDGYPGLSAAYGFKFKEKSIDNQGQKYETIARGDVQALIVYTTDGPLPTSGLTVLTDDKGFFPSYNIGTVVRDDTMQKYPQIKPVLDKLINTCDNDEMAAMNAEVSQDGKDPSVVAHEFLVNKGLISN